MRISGGVWKCEIAHWASRWPSRLILSCSAAASAQTKPPSDASKAPSSDPAHDLSGVWFDDHPRLITVMERYWAYTFTLEEPPMTPWGQAQFDAAKPSFGPHAYPTRRKQTIPFTTPVLPSASRGFFFIRCQCRSCRRPARSSCFSSRTPCAIRFLRMAARMTQPSALCGWGTRSGIGRETRWSRTP